MGPAHILDLDGVLDGLAQFRWVGAVQDRDVAGDAGEQGGVDPAGVQQNGLAGGEAVDISIKVVIGAQAHAVHLQLRQKLRGEAGGVGKQNTSFFREDEIAQKDRVAGDVVPPQVQQPGDVFQGGQEEGIGPLADHGPAKLRQLVPAGEAGVLLVQSPDGLGGEGRALGPDLVHQVQLMVELGPQLAGETMVAAAGAGVHTAAVKAERLLRLEALAQEFLDGGHARLPLLHEADAAALQLLGRLEKIAAVGPETGPVGKDQKGPGGAGEAGEILPAGKMRPHIFAAVKVSGGDQIGVDMILGHHVPEGLERVCHENVSFQSKQCSPEIRRKQKIFLKVFLRPGKERNLSQYTTA